MSATQLDPEAAALLERAARSSRPNAHLLPVEDARRHYDEECAAAETGQPVGAVSDFTIPVAGGEIPARLYRPCGEQLGAAVYLHGGGWILGSIESHDATCRALVNASSAAIVSVGYRRAPEHRFPTAAEDAYAACRHVVANAAELRIDPERIGVAGDSAGGNLAIAAALLARERGEPRLAFALLAYPVTTTDLDAGFDPAYAGIVLERDELLWHQENYFSAAEDRRSPLASPLDRADLRGFPPTLILTAGCDPIHAQGELFADALRRAEVEVKHDHHPGMMHGFLQFPTTLQEATRGITRAGAALSSRLAGAHVS
ncbi:MAG TPA: alpha/beta hydrolase [Solirubrobacteraceae bacterium]|nr:alpha/beta hydrolase [Solirubrobacteraceae bacterium]